MLARRRGGPQKALPTEILLRGWLLRGARAEETEDDAGGRPVIVLGRTGGAESGAVIVDVDDADFPVFLDAEVDAAAGFVGNAILGSLETADAADGDVKARAANQGFHKGHHAPAVAVIVVAAAEMVAVQDVLDASSGDVVVAGVADNLEPGLQVIPERTQAAAEVAGSSAAGDAVEGVAAKEFKEEILANAGERLLPAIACGGAANRFRRGLRGFRLRLRSLSGSGIGRRR